MSNGLRYVMVVPKAEVQVAARQLVRAIAVVMQLAKSIEMMNNSKDEIVRATKEGAVGNNSVAEKVTGMTEHAQEILQKVNDSREGTENLKKQVDKFRF